MPIAIPTRCQLRPSSADTHQRIKPVFSHEIGVLADKLAPNARGLEGIDVESVRALCLLPVECAQGEEARFLFDAFAQRNAISLLQTLGGTLACHSEVEYMRNLRAKLHARNVLKHTPRSKLNELIEEASARADHIMQNILDSVDNDDIHEALTGDSMWALRDNLHN